MSKTEQPSPDTPSPSQQEVDRFVHAVTWGSIDIIKEFIEAYPRHLDALCLASEGDRDAPGKWLYGCSTLAAAAYTGNTEIMQLLIESGADVNTRNKDGMTPIAFAGLKDNEEGVLLLLEKGAEWDVRWGNTSLIGLMTARATNPIFSSETRAPAIAILNILEERRSAEEKELERQRFPGVLEDTPSAPRIKLKPRKPPGL